MLFVGDLKDQIGTYGGTNAGAMSILTGISANYSIALGKPINVKIY